MTVGGEDENNNAEDWCGNFTSEDICTLTEEFSQLMEGASPTQVIANTNKNSKDVPVVQKISILITAVLQVSSLTFIRSKCFPPLLFLPENRENFFS